MTLSKVRERIKIVNTFKRVRRYGLSEEDSFTILSFMFEITWKGFEQYVADYFSKVGHFDKIIVTGGLLDKGIDIKGKKGNNYVAIQCKQYASEWVKEKDVLLFVEQTKQIREKLGTALSLYFITTSWINPQAKARALNNGIHVGCYKEILKMNQSLDIEAFLKEHKHNKNIISGIDVYKILDLYHYRVALGFILGDVFYFIERILRKFLNYQILYEKVEPVTKETNEDILKTESIFDKELEYK